MSNKLNPPNHIRYLHKACYGLSVCFSSGNYKLSSQLFMANLVS